MKLLINALVKFTCGLLLVGLLIFLPAGTLCYTGGWLLIGLLFAPMLVAGFVMLFKSPELLARRLDVKEKQSAQKGVIAMSGLMFLAGFVVAGLDFRFGWSRIPAPVTVAASVLFLAAYALYAEVLGKYIFEPHHQGGTGAIRGGYGPLRHCPPSHVYGHDSAVSDDAGHSGVLVRADRFCRVSCDYHCASER